jgi:hypothetical protein
VNQLAIDATGDSILATREKPSSPASQLNNQSMTNETPTLLAGAACGMERPDYGDYGNSEEMPVNFMADPRLAPEVVFMNVAPSNLETLMELDMRR